MSEEEMSNLLSETLDKKLEDAGFKKAPQISPEDGLKRIGVDEVVGEDKVAAQEANPEEAMKKFAERLEKIEEMSDRVQNEEPEDWLTSGENDGAPTTDEKN